jgi:hypothetical protein
LLAAAAALLAAGVLQLSCIMLRLRGLPMRMESSLANSVMPAGQQQQQ